jgi:hypothetical protein
MVLRWIVPNDISYHDCMTAKKIERIRFRHPYWKWRFKFSKCNGIHPIREQYSAVSMLVNWHTTPYAVKRPAKHPRCFHDYKGLRHLLLLLWACLHRLLGCFWRHLPGLDSLGGLLLVLELGHCQLRRWMTFTRGGRAVVSNSLHLIL